MINQLLSFYQILKTQCPEKNYIVLQENKFFLRKLRMGPCNKHTIARQQHKFQLNELFLNLLTARKKKDNISLFIHDKGITLHTLRLGSKVISDMYDRRLLSPSSHLTTARSVHQAEGPLRRYCRQTMRWCDQTRLITAWERGARRILTTQKTDHHTWLTLSCGTWRC